MKTTKPIKSQKQLREFKNYYLYKEEYRNYLLVSVCLNSALRISDVLKLKAEDFYSFEGKHLQTHFMLWEQKTGKYTEILINQPIKTAFRLYVKNCGLERGYIFKNRQGNPISRIQAYRIIRNGADAVGINASCHSLRKTFGYYAWKKGTPSVMLMKI